MNLLDIVHDDGRDLNNDIKANMVISSILVRADDHCVSCGKKFPHDVVVHVYDHKYGWFISDDLPLQWLSIQCDCGYHSSFNKLGINR